MLNHLYKTISARRFIFWKMKLIFTEKFSSKTHFETEVQEILVMVH